MAPRELGGRSLGGRSLSGRGLDGRGGFRAPLGGVSRINDPSDLFAGLTSGGWLDASDQLAVSAGTVGQSAPTNGGAVPWALFRRGSTVSASRGATELVTNGTFDTDLTGWTNASSGTGSISWSSGQMLLTANGTGNEARARTTVTTVVGRTYRMQVDMPTATAAINVGTAAGGAQLVNLSPSAGTTVVYWVATGTTTYIQFARTSAVANLLVDNVSVRDIAGFAVTQPTTSLRPTWDSTGAISFDLVDDYLFSTMEASLGSTSDVFYITAQGVIELYNQTVSSNWVIPNDEKFYQCVVTPSPLSGSNRAALRNWMKQKTGISAAKPFLVMYGDSMTYGTGATTWSTDTWWRRLAIARDYIPINRGVGGETSTQIKTRFLAQIANGNWYSDPRTIYTIWAGRNNFGSPATVLADIAAMVAALPAGARYLVISVLNGEAVAEYSGGADYINIVTNINAVLASTYGANYVDLRAYLVSQYDPGTPQDVTDFGHDITPSTLRNGAIHQNNAGHIKTQGYLASILDAKGW